MTFWQSTVNGGAAPLTKEALEAAISRTREVDDLSLIRRADKAVAWAALHLDYGSMTPEERVTAVIGQVSDVVSPDQYKAIAALIEKYRRD